MLVTNFQFWWAFSELVTNIRQHHRCSPRLPILNSQFWLLKNASASLKMNIFLLQEYDWFDKSDSDILRHDLKRFFLPILSWVLTVSSWFSSFTEFVGRSWWSIVVLKHKIILAHDLEVIRGHRMSSEVTRGHQLRWYLYVTAINL